MASVVDQTPTTAESASILLSPKKGNSTMETIDYSSIRAKVSVNIFKEYTMYI